jgi:hypothetical protein
MTEVMCVQAQSGRDSSILSRPLLPEEGEAWRLELLVERAMDAF